MNDKKEKVGMSSFNWIMSIFGIIFLSTFIILPPLFRLVLPEKEDEEIVEPVIIIQTINCSVRNNNVETHTENDEIEFKYYQDQLRSYKRTKEIIYADIEEYDEDKQLFGKLSTAFSIIEGVKYDATPNPANLNIIIDESYDFSLFSPRTVTIPGETESITITSDFKSGDSITQIGRAHV